MSKIRFQQPYDHSAGMPLRVLGGYDESGTLFSRVRLPFSLARCSVIDQERISDFSSWKMKSTPDIRLPPGPPGKWRPTLSLMRDARGTMQNWVAEYGDPFFINALNGPIVLTGRPDLIETIFSADPANFETFAKNALSPILGSGSMLQLDGEPHRRERKLIMPMFHGQRMKSYVDSMQRIALRSFERNSEAGVVSMLDITTEISLDIIMEVILGAEDEEAVAKLAKQSAKVMQRMWPIFIFSPKTQFRFFGLAPWARFQKEQHALRNILAEEVKKRESTLESREDILSMLAAARYEDGSAMELDHLLDELGTFLFAGHETTAIAMAWAVYHLLNNQDAREQLVAELDANSDKEAGEIARLPWLNAVVSESLRLNPVVSDVLRLLKEPMELGEFRIPAGYTVAPAIVLAHYNEEVFPNPQRFDPSRFIDKRFSPSEYLPFGGGVRRCAGAAFATHEMAIALATLFSNYNLELREPKQVVPKRRNITIGPSTGIRVEIKPR